MHVWKRVAFAGFLVVLVCVFTQFSPISTATASAHALTPLQLHSIQETHPSLQAEVPFSPYNNCDLDGDPNGYFPCAVESYVAPGCLRERSMPYLNTGDLTGNCYQAGTILNITCQTVGDMVNNYTDVWDVLLDGGYVSDYYMSTSGTNGSFSPNIPYCPPFHG
jgi:hypothetical protein